MLLLHKGSGNSDFFYFVIACILKGWQTHKQLEKKKFREVNKAPSFCTQRIPVVHPHVYPHICHFAKQYICTIRPSVRSSIRPPVHMSTCPSTHLPSPHLIYSSLNIICVLSMGCAKKSLLGYNTVQNSQRTFFHGSLSLVWVSEN